MSPGTATRIPTPSSRPSPTPRCATRWGTGRTRPARIGGISDQTQLVLDKFGFAPPPLLRTVRTQVRDLDFDTPPVLSQAVTVHHAWALMQDEGRHIESMPVATEDGRLFGMLTTSDIAAYEMRFVSDAAVAGIPLFNLLSSLDGPALWRRRAAEELSGELVVALPGGEGRQIPRGAIVLCGRPAGRAARRDGGGRVVRGRVRGAGGPGARRGRGQHVRDRHAV